MMKRFQSILVGISALTFATSALAISTNEPFLCASMQVWECIDGAACETVLPEEVAAPTFMRVNVKQQEIRIFEDQEPSKIAHVASVEGRLILQGADESDEDHPDGAGWTVSIEQDTGRFVGTATLLQGAVVIFGACTEYTY